MNQEERRYINDLKQQNRESSRMNQHDILKTVAQINDYLDLGDDAYVLLLQTIRDTQNPVLIAKCLQVAFAHGRAVAYKSLAGQAERSEQYVKILVDLQT